MSGGLTPESRARWLDGSRRGGAAWAAKRRIIKAAGMTAARAWNAAHRPVAAVGHMPFAGHRTVAQVLADEVLARPSDRS